MLHTIIHKAVTDPGFRAALLADPQAATVQYNFEISSEEIVTLSQVAHLIATPSEDLLARLIAVAEGPDQVWQSRSLSQRYVLPAR